MAKNSHEHSYAQHLTTARLLTLLFLSVGAMVVASDAASAQQQQRNQVRRPATATAPPTPDTPTAALPSPEIDKTSALGQALAACKQDNEVQEALRFPD
jgi:hypothetical protein